MQDIPTWLEIDLDNLVHNLTMIRERLDHDVSILLTVKADAYGHGAVQVAGAAAGYVDCFGVATVHEAIELRLADIETDILILSPVLVEEIPAVVDNGLQPTIPSREFAEELSDYCVRRRKVADVHVEIDTGMGRTGFLSREAKDVIAWLRSLPGVRLAGLFTHFPSSDVDRDFTLRQVQDFRALLEDLKREGAGASIIHSANSAAICNVPESHLDMVRPGLLAYGHFPGGIQFDVAVRPVVTWKSRLVQVRDVPAGWDISYGRTFSTRRATVLGVVPVGYGHGLPYRLTDRGHFLVDGQEVPILGRVTMDMTMVDLTDVAERPRPGDEVVLIGRQGDGRITVDDMASWAGTISYEILCSVSKRVPRTYIRGGRVEAFKTLLGVVSNDVGV